MKTREIHIGDRVIGGGNPILIQSMWRLRLHRYSSLRRPDVT